MDVLFNEDAGSVIHPDIENIAKVDPVQTLRLVDGRPPMMDGCLTALLGRKHVLEALHLRKQGCRLLIREVLGHDQVATRQKDGLSLQVLVMSGAEHELVSRVVSLDLSDHGVKAKYLRQGARADVIRNVQSGK